MRLRALLLVFMLALLALFTFMNWAVFNAPTALTLGFAEVSAPLGIVMLAVTVFVSLLFLVFILMQQAGVIMEGRRFAKELKGQRDLADKAEASRFTELRTFLDGELRKMEAQGAASNREIGARVEKLEAALQNRMGETSKSVEAHLGEIEDKLDQALRSARS